MPQHEIPCPWGYTQSHFNWTHMRHRAAVSIGQGTHLQSLQLGAGGVGDLNYVVNQAQLISVVSAALGVVRYLCSWPAKLLDEIKVQLPLHGQQQLTDLIRLPIQGVAAGIVVT